MRKIRTTRLRTIRAVLIVLGSALFGDYRWAADVVTNGALATILDEKIVTSR